MCHSRTTLFNFFLNTKGSFGKAQRFCIILAVGEVLAWFQNYNFLSQCETSERRKVSCALPLSVALMTRTICKGLKGCATAREREGGRCAGGRAHSSSAEWSCPIKQKFPAAVVRLYVVMMGSTISAAAKGCEDCRAEPLYSRERESRSRGWMRARERERASERDVRSAAMFRGSHIAW